MFVKNSSQLLTKSLDKDQLDLRKVALRSLEVALTSVKPKNLMQNSIKLQGKNLVINTDIFDLSLYKSIYIIGGGKAVAEMTASLENLLSTIPEINYQGTINIQEGLEIEDLNLSEKIQIYYASHPIPNKVGLEGTKSMIKLIHKATEDDLIFFLLSGGGSALLPLPKESVTLDDLKALNLILLSSGASIHEINTVRKHISDIKGGNLARFVSNTSRASLVSLIISDVVGNNLDIIASGPTVPDCSTFSQASDILHDYNIYKTVPSSVRNVIENGIINLHLENPKSGDPCFNKVYNYLIGSSDLGAQRIIKFLKDQHFETHYYSNEITGEAKDYGRIIAQKIIDKITGVRKEVTPSKYALIGTGELTVTLNGDGIGGRNQEMLLSVLHTLKSYKVDKKFLVMGANLDGIEGNSKAMGAIIDNDILYQISESEIDTSIYLANNDSNSFFRLLKTEIITGPTGCNVNDIILILYQS